MILTDMKYIQPTEYSGTPLSGIFPYYRGFSHFGGVCFARAMEPTCVKLMGHQTNVLQAENCMKIIIWSN